VPPSGDRFVRRSNQAEQDIPHGVDSAVPLLQVHARALRKEAAGSVVQERRVGHAQRGRDGRVALVSRAADRIEARVSRAQPACSQIEVATL
jgi:hypothetical protein